MVGGSRRRIVPLACILAAVLAAVYWCFDPAQTVWMPRCMWKVSTGTDCPGCGSQRMMHALMHGDFESAWQANAFALCALPVIAFLIWLEFNRERRPRLYKMVYTPWSIIAAGVSIVLWWIVRNL